MMLVGVLLNYLIRPSVHLCDHGRSGLLIWTWAIIIVSHLAYRRAVRAGRNLESPFAFRGRR